MSAEGDDRQPVQGLVGRPFGDGLRIGIAAGLFNRSVSRLLVEGARRTLETAGVAPADIVVAWGPRPSPTPAAMP
jgi:6,7-dimethyl-8-ribityllumazine synthase